MDVLGVAPSGLWVGAGETDPPGVLLIIGVDGDGLLPGGLRLGFKAGFNMMFGFVFGAVLPVPGAGLVGWPVWPDGAVLPERDALPD